MGLRVSDLAIMRRLARQKWGGINSQRKVANGVYWFDCEGHGGYVVDFEKYPKVKDFKEIVETRYNSGSYYTCEQRFAVLEEDCDWAVLEYLYPEIMEKNYNIYSENWSSDYSLDDYKETVRKCVENWNEEYLKKEIV